MSRRDFFNKLRQIGFEVVKQENLPMPADIKFIVSLDGTRRVVGVCTQKKIDSSFKIKIHTVEAKFVQDYEGKYKDKTTGIRLRRVSGDFRSEEDLVNTLAHEIAHLKFWKHGAQHISYTNHLEDIIKTKLAIEVN